MIKDFLLLTPLFIQGNPVRVKGDSAINRSPEK